MMSSGLSFSSQRKWLLVIVLFAAIASVALVLSFSLLQKESDMLRSPSPPAQPKQAEPCHGTSHNVGNQNSNTL